MNILILQKNTGRAGAQNSLRRLLQTEALRKHRIVVVSGPAGWFVDQVERLGVTSIRVDYPSARSLAGRLFGTPVWLEAVTGSLKDLSFLPDVMHANNHVEAPFLSLLKRRYPHALMSVMLRDAYIDYSGYQKYQCRRCDVRAAVSEALATRISWDDRLIVIHNGVMEAEIHLFPPRDYNFPRRWLVVGNPAEGKGWFDVLAALERLGAAGLTAAIDRVEFTGIPSGSLHRRYRQARSSIQPRVPIAFVPPYEDLGRACADFDLVLAPSRNESFGMALLEACCSGRCVVASRTGIAPRILTDAKRLFTPGAVDELVASLTHVIENWSGVSHTLALDLDLIRSQFNVEKNAQSLIACYEQAVLSRSLDIRQTFP